MPRPQLWVLAGGNGAGKTTFYAKFLEREHLPFINADQIARQLDADHSITISYEAARIAGRICDEFLRHRQSFCFETVFSHPSKIDFIGQAKALGYEIVLVFIHLDNVALNKARVQQRVSEGGHPVPEPKIETRIPRTLQYVKSAIALCDRVEILDNASYEDPFLRIASIADGITTFHLEPPPQWAVSLIEKE